MCESRYNRTVLLLAVLSYNVGAGRLLGYGRHRKSRLLRKIESGDKNFHLEFVSFCRYKGKVLRGLVKRRRWSLPCFMYPDYQYASCDIFMLRKGRFPAVLFSFLIMYE